MMPDERDGPGQRDGGAGGERRADERHPLRPRDVDAARGGRFGAHADQIEHARQRGEARRMRAAIGTSAATIGA